MRVFNAPLLPVFLLFSVPAMAGVIKGPADPPPPVHELIAELEGDFSGLPEQDDPRFGRSVAIDGDTLAVGAPGTLHGSSENDTIRRRGAVFVYRRQGGHWVQLQRIMVFTGGQLDNEECGHSVALAGDHLLIGCPHYERMGAPRGRAVFYTRNLQTGFFGNAHYFADTSEQANSECGYSVALIEGQPGTDSPNAIAAVGCPNRRDFPEGDFGVIGAVDVYSKLELQEEWEFATSLSLPGVQSVTRFGHSVNLNRTGPSPGMTLLLSIGLPATSNGQVRVYAMNDQLGTDWDEEQSITGPTSNSRFGHSVHMLFGRLAIGAPMRTVALPGPGGVPVQTPVGSFTIAYRTCPFNNPCSWLVQTDEFLGLPPTQPAPAAQNRLGQSVQMLAADRVAAGESEWHVADFGRARHYQLVDGDWDLNGDEPFYEEEIIWTPTSVFGTSVAGDHGWLAIGAPGYIVPDKGPRGRVYVYAYNNALFRDRFEQ